MRSAAQFMNGGITDAEKIEYFIGQCFHCLSSRV